jgi:hypothetical protein
MRLIINQKAFKKLYFLKACIEYSLQVGVKRQVGGKKGEIAFL